jgi:hypothetical protein
MLVRTLIILAFATVARGEYELLGDRPPPRMEMAIDARQDLPGGEMDQFPAGARQHERFAEIEIGDEALAHLPEPSLENFIPPDDFAEDERPPQDDVRP